MSPYLPNEIVRPDGWPRPQGYADAVLATGRQLFISGQIGWDPVTANFASEDLAQQAAQAMRNISAILSAAGGSPQHLVRLTWFVTSRDAYVSARAAIGLAYRGIFGAHYPAMSVVEVRALVEPQAVVEIEATAVLPDRAP